MLVHRMNKVCSAIVACVLLLGMEACFASRQPHALEQFEISTLSVYSISPTRADGSRFAYVKDPGGYLHHVEVGEYLGVASGRIEEISASDVVVIELHEIEGTYKEVRIVLRLPSVP